MFQHGAALTRTLPPQPSGQGVLRFPVLSVRQIFLSSSISLEESFHASTVENNNNNTRHHRHHHHPTSSTTTFLGRGVPLVIQETSLIMPI